MSAGVCQSLTLSGIYWKSIVCLHVRVPVIDCCRRLMTARWRLNKMTHALHPHWRYLFIPSSNTYTHTHTNSNSHTHTSALVTLQQISFLQFPRQHLVTSHRSTAQPAQSLFSQTYDCLFSCQIIWYIQHDNLNWVCVLYSPTDTGFLKLIRVLFFFHYP